MNSEPIIVFTEYRDTLRQLAVALPGALQLHGGLTGSERASVQRRFNETGGVLLATDAAADGLNLQRRCRLLVNYELPWNPARLEQRIGRVDRIGQRRRVHAISLVARDTAEDLVVAALARRLVRVSSTLGERDRLAALLTDARTARAVITGTSAVAADDTPQAPPLPRPAAGEYRAHEAAAQIRAGAANARAGGFVAASRIRGGGPIRDGAVAVVHARAVNDREIVAQGALLVHVSEALCRTAAPGGDVRAGASRVSEVIAAGGAAIDAIGDWFARATALHRTALLSRIARERAIHDAATPRPELQPGLFDRRATAGRERADHLEERLDEDRLEQQRRLAASLDVRLECSTAAVLTLWR